MHIKRWLLTLQQGHGSKILDTAGWIKIRSLDKRHLCIDGNKILK
jgi:hypothetical protein